MKKLISVYFISLLAASLWAIVPTWQVNQSQFQYTMEIFALAEIDGVELNHANDQLGAFVGNECRGVVSATDNPFTGKKTFFLVVYANKSAENLSFKVYDASKDEVQTIQNTLTFVMNGSQGSIIAPYVMSNLTRTNGLEMQVLNADENLPLGTAVAQLIYYSNGNSQASTFTLVEGLSDNASFSIKGDSLCLNTSWNYEQKAHYNVTVKSASASGSLTKEFQIDLNDVNEAPTALLLSKDSIDENVAIGTVLGHLSVVDEDNGDEFVYSIVGENAFFEVVGAELLVKANLNYEFLSSQRLLLQVEDKVGHQINEELFITINNVNDAPSLITISADSLPAGLPANMTIGCFKVVDEDVNDAPVLSLIEGEVDNELFMLNPNNLHLISATSLSVNDGDTRTLKMKADDGKGGVLISDFEIRILDKGYSYTEKNVNVMFTNAEVFTHYFEVEEGQITLTISTKDLYGNYVINSTAKVTKYDLFDMTGKKLQSGMVNAHEFAINISAQAIGQYILNIYTEKGVFGEEISVMAK